MKNVDTTPGDVDAVLRSEFERWQGTPYVFGGTTSAGMDCSGFVQRVFSDAFGIHLPRTTGSQVKEGHRVDAVGLQAGDLVFFRPPTKTRHVGIYLSDGEFAHASTSSGVTVSELSLPYWQKSYWTARRILDEPPVKLAAETVSTPAMEGETRPAGFRPERVGW